MHKPCRALLVMVHGSPQGDANSPMFEVVDRVRQRAAYDMVHVGFMECNQPTIPEAIAECAAEGATLIVAVPYFLHTGNHVASDLPDILDEARASYPHIEFRLADFLGAAPAVTAVLIDRALAASSQP